MERQSGRGGRSWKVHSPSPSPSASSHACHYRSSFGSVRHSLSLFSPLLLPSPLNCSQQEAERNNSSTYYVIREGQRERERERERDRQTDRNKSEYAHTPPSFPLPLSPSLWPSPTCVLLESESERGEIRIRARKCFCLFLSHFFFLKWVFSPSLSRVPSSSCLVSHQGKKEGGEQRRARDLCIVFLGRWEKSMYNYFSNFARRQRGKQPSPFFLS